MKKIPRRQRRQYSDLEAQNKELRERNACLEQRVLELEAQNAELKKSLAAAGKNSRNSSKPPSSDIVKPPAKFKSRARGKSRGPGAQKGHPKHERPDFAPEQIDHHIAYRLDRCPLDDSHKMASTDQVAKSLQQVELIKKPFVVTEHTAYMSWCEDCGCYHSATLPGEMSAAGLFGPRLTSFVAFLKGKLHSSYSAIECLLEDVLGLSVSRGYLAKLLQKAARAFEAPYDELLEALPGQVRLNIDETGHTENGKRLWTWCFRAPAFVVFKIADRSSQILSDLLGSQFKGILGCDCYSAYRKYARKCGVLLQFCMAHLIREVKYLCEYPDKHVRKYGEGLIEALKKLFAILHRKDRMSDNTFQRKLAEAEEQIWEAALAPRAWPNRFGGRHPPRLIENMVMRFIKHGEGYFRFITSPGVEPTNNIAEQAFRFIVIGRLITQGTRSLRGRRASERLWTVLASCSIQNRSAFEWMLQAITAHYKKEPSPSLLSNSADSHS